MATHTVKSCQGVPIRLTHERWGRIVEENCELAGMLYEVLDVAALPDRVTAGTAANV